MFNRQKQGTAALLPSLPLFPPRLTGFNVCTSSPQSLIVHCTKRVIFLLLSSSSSSKEFGWQPDQAPRTTNAQLPTTCFLSCPFANPACNTRDAPGVRVCVCVHERTRGAGAQYVRTKPRRGTLREWRSYGSGPLRLPGLDVLGSMDSWRPDARDVRRVYMRVRDSQISREKPSVQEHR